MAKIRMIAAEVNGGKNGNSRYIATFTPQKAATNTGTATVLAQTRRLHGNMALLRRSVQLYGDGGGNCRRIG